MALQLVAHQALSGGQWSVCWMASIPLAIKPCMTCLAGWRRKKVFVLNLRHWRVGAGLSACVDPEVANRWRASAQEKRGRTRSCGGRREEGGGRERTGMNERQRR